MARGLLVSAAALAACALGNSQQVPRCKLGAATNMDVSCVIMGSLHLHEAGTPQGVLQKIQAAQAVGMTTWDTSDVYNSMPELLGAALQLQPGLREQIEVRITTILQCGRCDIRTTSRSSSAIELAAAVCLRSIDAGTDLTSRQVLLVVPSIWYGCMCTACSLLTRPSTIVITIGSHRRLGCGRTNHPTVGMCCCALNTTSNQQVHDLKHDLTASP